MGAFDEICRDIATYLEFHIDGAMNSSEPESEASNADCVSTYFQAMGICELLVDAEVDAFFHHLIRSAQARVWLLERAAAQQGYPELVIRASQLTGFFGAVAAEQWPLARTIARLSVKSWSRTVEYEEDYACAHFLHRHVLTAGPTPPEVAGPTELADILDRMETALEGGPSERLGLARALLARDADLAAEAMNAFVDGQTALFDRMRRLSLSATEGLFTLRSSISVEGLAWLALFEQAGIRLRDEYPYCPSLVRSKPYAPFEVTLFPAVPLTS